MSETLGIKTCERLHPFACTQNIMSKRMSLKEQILEFIVNEFGRRIVITLDFIANNIHLMFDFLFGISAVENNIN